MFKNKFSKSVKKAAKQQPVFKQDYIDNCHRTYSCIHCRAHLANHDELVSKLFQGNHGRAYLFNKVVNVGCKQAVQRELLTGLHAVADIYCDSCQTTLGWKYEQAFVPSQKYKEGKYIIELVHMLKENNWDLTSYNAKELIKEVTTNNSGPNSKKVLTSARFINKLEVGNGCNNRLNNYRENSSDNSVVIVLPQPSSVVEENQVRPSVNQTSESSEPIEQVDIISNGIEMIKIDLQATRTSN